MTFNLNDSIEITPNQIKGIIRKSFSSKYSFEQIRKNKYFLQFDTLEDIINELKERINNNKIIIKENEDNLIINIPLPSSKNKEIIFELKSIIKYNNDRFNELTDLLMKLNTEMSNIKNETKILNEKYNNLENNKTQLKNENMQLKNEISDIKEKETLLASENIQLKNEINNLEENEIKLKNENSNLKNEYTELKKN